MQIPCLITVEPDVERLCITSSVQPQITCLDDVNNLRAGKAAVVDELHTPVMLQQGNESSEGRSMVPKPVQDTILCSTSARALLAL